MDVIAKYKTQYEQEGYFIIPNFWSEEELEALESSILYYHEMQARKVPVLLAELEGISNYDAMSPQEKIDTLVSLYEKHSTEAAFHVTQMLENNVACTRMTSSEKIVDLTHKIMGTDGKQLNTTSIRFLVNQPETTRLLVNWHHESFAYAKRRSFLNYWFPVFKNKGVTDGTNNGTLKICPKSHLKPIHDFVESRSFDSTTGNQGNARYQFEVPAELMEEYEQLTVDAKRGDLVVFHQYLLHSSSRNETNKPTYTINLRYFDYSGDYTWSADDSVKPYNRDYSLPGMSTKAA